MMIKGGEKERNGIRKIFIILFWIALWEILSLLVNNPLLFAGPWDTLLRLCNDVIGMDFWLAVGLSICRILAGFFLGMIFGSIFGILSYKWKFFKEFLSPVMHFSKAVPVASFVVVILIWWGSDFLSTASCFLVVLPMAYISFLEGLEHTDQKLLEMAKVFCMPVKNRIFYIYRPSLIPFMEGCMTTALGMGIKSGIAAEVIGISNYSIGGEMYLSKIYLDTSGVFSWTAVVILISVILEKIMQKSLRQIIKWNPNIQRNKLQRTSYDEIHIKDMSKIFHHMNKKVDMKVLTGIHKDLNAGEIVCLMAPSGYGKTTLLHILAGILRPDNGQVVFVKKGIETDHTGTNDTMTDTDTNDTRSNGIGPDDTMTEIGKLHPGMVFQEDRLCEDLDAVMNVKLISSDWKKTVACLKDLLPDDALTIPVRNLSGGMRRRVCIARALASNTDYLILDEPFGGLDADTRSNTIKVILQYRENRLLLIATHEEEDVERLSGKIWRLKDHGDRMDSN